MTPGTQPHSVSMQIIRKDPQPLSTTANGGRIIQIIARSKPITSIFTIEIKELPAENSVCSTNQEGISSEEIYP